MSEKGHLLLLILCGILCQGIIATLSSDDDINREAPDLLVREKRVVTLDQHGNGVISIEDANYMTMIKESNRANCIGVILSRHNVITAATCVTLALSIYQIINDSAFAHLGKSHNVSSKLTNYGNPPHEHNDGIALLTVDPPFTYGPKTGNIQLYSGPLHVGLEVTVTGWGCGYPPLPPVRLQKRLRQIKLPLLDLGQCEHVYGTHALINYKYICTYHERRYCARTDVGAPLVVNNMLAGIHVVKPEFKNQPNPDVFINLQPLEYNFWIRQHIRS